jgi:hypothetical protein
MSYGHSLVPVLNAVTTDIHLGATLAAGDWTLASFDLTMLALAFIFAMAARKAAQKASVTRSPKAAPSGTLMEPAE